jgi:hypothetical protein
MSEVVTLLGYAVLAAAMAANARSLPAVVADMTRAHAVRWAVLAAWLWFGWHVFVRATHA